MHNDDNTNYVITIGRQFGSGGRELGQHLAEAFGIAYYDKKLLLEAAQAAGVSPEFIEKRDERFPSFINSAFSFNMGMSAMPWYNQTSISDDNIYKTLSDVIHDVAKRGSCVVVGRSADYVLRDHPRHVSIFVHAPLEECVARIVARGDKLDKESARLLAQKTNKLRANYYNFYTDKHWGAAESYDLTLDSSKTSMDGLVGVIAAYVRSRFGFDPLKG